MAQVHLRGVRKSYDKLEVIHGVDIEIADGEFVVIVGPSGCGKSTLLRMVAGLERITGGEIAIGDRVVNELEPKDRDIAMVFQNYALYPHFSVYENMAYGLKIRGLSKAEIDQRVQKAAKILELGTFLQRKPRQLSGGQRQRVAIGRSIVRNPKVFLFDEPLSNLDAKLRVQMRLEIKRLQRELDVTSIYVTHDQAEAMTMSDRVAVMLAGRLEQVAPPRRLYDDPETLAVAEFVGSPKINVMPVEGGFHAVRPEAMQLVAPYEAGAIAGHVRLVEHMGSESLVHVEVKGQPTPLIARIDAHAERDPQRGEAVGLKPLPHRVLKFDSEGRRVR